MNADPRREISEEDVRRYDEDGVVLLKGMFDQAWLKHLSEQIEVDIAHPGPLHVFYDQLRIKEPGTVKRTPWHHDMPYWPLVVGRCARFGWRSIE